MGKQKAWASAIISGIIASLTSLLTAFQGQEVGLGTITTSQWITAMLAFFVAFGSAGGVTYKVTNADQGATADQGRNADRPQQVTGTAA